MKKNNKKKINLKHLIKNDKNIVVFYISIILFIILTILVLTKILNPIDSSIESYIIGIRNDKLTSIMSTITNIARAYSLIAISILLFFIIKDKKHSLAIIINLICVFLTSQIAKFIFKRPRPNGDFLVYAKGYGYPSGHAMVSMAYFSFLTYLILQKVHNKLLKILLIIITIITILLIGFSRIYLGVHYTTDVVAGYILATIYLIIYISLLTPKKEEKQ